MAVKKTVGSKLPADEKPDFGPCSERQRLVLMDEETDILLIGGGNGGGKSHMALLKALKYCQDPNAKVLILRLSYPLLKAVGGLIDESHHIMPHFGAKWKVQPCSWHFPNGAMIKFVAMPADLTEVQGWQCTTIIIDEGAEFKLADILALKARLRGARYKGKLSMVITCNPSNQSFLYPWVAPLLDKTTGIPLPGSENITRWFVILNGNFKWGTSKEELFKEHGAGYKFGIDFIPVSFRFIGMDIYSNPILMKANPGYLANLLAQSRVAQLRFLKGSWTAIVEGASFFQRSWLPIVLAPPISPTSTTRAWDLAATLPSESNPDPDYTAGVLMSRDREGIYYIEHSKRDRIGIDGVMKLIVATAEEDGLEIPVCIPMDTAAGGKAASFFYTRYFAEQGLIIKGVKMSGHAGKVQRFLPFASLCEAGHVRLVAGDWNEDYLVELENFTGGRAGHDDQVDATSDAFGVLCRQSTIPTFSIPSLTQPSVIQTIS